MSGVVPSWLPVYAVGLALGVGLSGVVAMLAGGTRAADPPAERADAASTSPNSRPPSTSPAPPLAPNPPIPPASPASPASPVSPTTAASPTTGARRPLAVAEVDLRSVAVAAVAGILAVLATGWPVAGVIAAVAAYGLPRLLRRTSAASSIATLEAIATWTELLQGTLAASAGLGQAIVATADLSPAAIRVATGRLAAQIQAGVDPRAALLEFADDVGDPCADRVVCSLLLAFTERAQRLGDLLGALAESTREEVALRLRVETSRASVRSGVRTVVVFSVLFAAALAVLAHPYLAPYGSPTGQVVLAAVGGLYAAGLVLLVTMARPPRGIRLLGTEVVER